MSDVKRYTFKGAAGEYVYAPDFDLVTAERDALQLRLNATDQRIDDLVSALTRVHVRCEAFVRNERDMKVASVGVMLDIATRALAGTNHSGDTNKMVSLREHCKQCADTVKTWPEWKQQCLGSAPDFIESRFGKTQ